jgi:hypothetical protein
VLKQKEGVQPDTGGIFTSLQEKPPMEIDLDTFLVTVYVHVDDIYRERFSHLKPIRPGPQPRVSDSEVLLLALLWHWHGARSERAFMRFVRRHWSGYFPAPLSQSSFNRRARDLRGVLAGLGPEIARRVSAVCGTTPAYETADAAAVPLLRPCRGKRSCLFGDGASFGKGGSSRSWYYGIKLLCVVDQHGIVSGFAACRADTEERWLAEAVLRWRHNPLLPQPSAEEMREVLGPPHRKEGRRIGPQAIIWPREGAGRTSGCDYLADRGYTGREWGRHWRNSYGANVLTPDGQEPHALRQHNRRRQLVERTFSMLLDHFGLAFPKARSMWGLMTRVAAKIAAFDMAVFMNYLFNRPPHSLPDTIS